MVFNRFLLHTAAQICYNGGRNRRIGKKVLCMKLKYRILAWLTVVALLMTALPMAVAADTVPSRYGRGILAQMEDAEALLATYDVLVDGVDRAAATIELPYDIHPLTWAQVTTVFDLVYRDYPEYFWISGAGSGSVMGNTVLSFSPAYHMTGATLTAARTALEQKVAALTADLEGKSDYDKSLILHDRVADTVNYVFNNLDQTSYAALVNGSAVCAGYARAYQLLLNRVGIPSWYVTGYSLDPSSGDTVAHGWDMVQLDGQWYHTDVTWDDQDSYIYYAYLNVTDSVITADHVITAYNAYLPAANATTHNYFYRNNLVFDSFDAARVAGVFRNYPIARFWVTTDLQTFMDAFSANALSIIQSLGFTSGRYSYGRSALGQEVILTLTAEHDCRYTAVTVAPTCGTDGYAVEECSYDFCHNQRNYTTLPATGVHTYDNGCDVDCNACGAVRTVNNHTYDNACDADCNTCGAVRTVGDHAYDNAYDPDCNACGAVREVIAPSDNPRGDVSGDEAVNNRDLIMIIRYLNGWDVEMDLYAADCDGDGAVTIKDVALLQQYVNGWNVTLK